MNIATLMSPVPVIGITATMYEVFDLFRANRDITVFPVVNTLREPVGVIREIDVKTYVYAAFGRELVGRLSIKEFVTLCRCVDISMPVEELLENSAIALNPDGLIVTANGLYEGFLEPAAIMRLYDDNRLATQAKLMQAQKMESIGTLAGGIAHDFNNILSAISGYTQMIKIRCDITLEHPQYRSIASIESLIGRASTLTRQLLGFARGGRYKPVVLDLNDVVSHLSIIVRGSFDTSYSVVVESCEEELYIRGDRGQIEQSLLNLLINARDSMATGGMICVRTRRLLPGSDEVTRHLDGTPLGGIAIDVQDAGCGMSPAVMNRIFEPFFTTKEQGKGSGMGLAMVYGIVKNHKGDIGVTSVEGTGTTFTLYFPGLAPGQSTSLPSRTGSRTPCIRVGQEWVRSVLIVDDEWDILTVASSYFEQRGVTVYTAADADAGLEAFKKHYVEIDAVILDIIMPRVSGQHLFHELRAIAPDVRVVFISGYSLNTTMSELLEHPDTAFLQKPFPLEELFRTVNRATDDPGKIQESAAEE